jgi:hypothetical protein
LKPRHLKNFHLHLNCRTVSFEDVDVIRALGHIYLISNPVVIELRKFDGYTCAFDRDGFLGLCELPQFMLRMLEGPEPACIRDAEARNGLKVVKNEVE